MSGVGGRLWEVVTYGKFGEQLRVIKYKSRMPFEFHYKDEIVQYTWLYV